MTVKLMVTEPAVCKICGKTYDREKHFKQQHNFICPNCRDFKEQRRVSYNRKAIVRRLQELCDRYHLGDFALWDEQK